MPFYKEEGIIEDEHVQTVASLTHLQGNICRRPVQMGKAVIEKHRERDGSTYMRSKAIKGFI